MRSDVTTWRRLSQSGSIVDLLLCSRSAFLEELGVVFESLNKFSEWVLKGAQHK